MFCFDKHLKFFFFPDKTCPALPIPYDGMAVCKNPDLNIVFDYSTKNSTFAELHRISDVELFSEKMPIDTECTFRCKSGYYLVGSNSRNCLPLAKWDGLHTTCKRKKLHFYRDYLIHLNLQCFRDLMLTITKNTIWRI